MLRTLDNASATRFRTFPLRSIGTYFIDVINQIIKIVTTILYTYYILMYVFIVIIAVRRQSVRWIKTKYNNRAVVLIIILRYIMSEIIIIG